MKPVLPLTALIACLTVAPFALAQQGPAHRGHFGLLQHDTNQDGQLTYDEFDASLKSQFAASDTDGNGTITSAERKASRDARRDSAMAMRFASLDANSDGNLSLGEFSARPDRAEQNGPDRQRVGGPPRLRRGPGPEQAKDVTYADFSERSLATFEAIDKDSNRVITQEELHAAAEGQRTGRR